MRAWWKWLGLAGVIGLAAPGLVVPRDERERRSSSPEEIRERLRQRRAEAEQGGATAAPGGG